MTRRCWKIIWIQLLEDDPTLLEVDWTLLEDDSTLLEDNSDAFAGIESNVPINAVVVDCSDRCC